MIKSANKYKKDVRSFEKKRLKAYEELESQLTKLKKKEYEEQELVKKAVGQLSKKNRHYSTHSIQIEKVGHYGRGRRKADSLPVRYSYRLLSVELKEDLEKSQRIRSAMGKFVLVTNELNKREQGEKLFKRSVDDLLKLYKEEQQKVERGFRFIKDPKFMLAHLFLKLPRRIVALCMVMCLCLLIYCLAEWTIRQELAKVNGRLPNQVDKLVSNPTMRWIFTQMSGISLEHRAGKDYAEIVGLRNIHRDILQYFGDKVKAYYGL